MSGSVDRRWKGSPEDSVRGYRPVIEETREGVEGRRRERQESLKGVLVLSRVRK